MNRTAVSVTALVAAASFANFASAQTLDEGDIGLLIEDSQIVVGLIAEEEEPALLARGGEGPVEETNVFLAEIGLVEFEPSDGTEGSGGTDVFQDILPPVSSFSTNTPGFDSGPEVFTPGTRVGFDVLGFSVWDPIACRYIDAGDASAAGGTVAESMAIEFNLIGFQTTDIGVAFPPVADAFPFDGLTVFSNGRSHRHFNFTLLPVDTSGIDPIPQADPGVYALQLAMTTTDVGIADSDPFVIVFAYQVAETDSVFTDAVRGAFGLNNAADVAAPFETLDLSDVQTFLIAFSQNDKIADVAEPFGTFDLADVQTFLIAFAG